MNKLFASILSVTLVAAGFLALLEFARLPKTSVSDPTATVKYEEPAPAPDDPLGTARDAETTARMAESGPDPESVVIDPWLNGFNYRKLVTINSAGAFSNYEVRMTVDTATPINTSKMRGDCGDLRFTSSDGYSQLNYWIESGCNSGSTVVWVKIPSLAAGSTYIFMYYGNSTAGSLSNPNNVFMFYDDFDDGSLDTGARWNTPPSNSYYGYAETGGEIVIYIGTRGKTKVYNGGFELAAKNAYNIADTAWEVYHRAQKDNADCYYTDQTIGAYLKDTAGAIAKAGRHGQAAYKYYSSPANWESGSWNGALTGYELDAIMTTASNTRYYRNGSLAYTDSRRLNNTAYPSISVSTGPGSSQTGWAENLATWVRLRKWQTSEPTSSFGAEDRLITMTMVNPGDSFAYRKPVTVSSGSAQTDYQVLITLDTSTLISQGKMRSDCADIRVRDTDGSTNLAYWMQSGCNSGSTRVWAKIGSIPAGSKTIYVYYGNAQAISASDINNTFFSGNNNFEIDGVGTNFSNISFWDWREGRAIWADGNWPGTTWGSTVYGKDMKVDGSRFFNGSKAIYSYVKTHDDSGAEYYRYGTQELYLEPSYRILALNDYIRVRIADVNWTAPSRWAWRIVSILSDSANSQYSILRCNSWGANEGCTPQNNYESLVAGADGRTWSVYRINIPSNYDKNALSLTMRHWQDSWDSEEAYSYFYFDYLDDFRVRKYASPEPTTSVGSEVSLGFDPETVNWVWQSPTNGNYVRSGSATNWTWTLWQNNNAGLTVPNGSATNWTWYP